MGSLGEDGDALTKGEHSVVWTEQDAVPAASGPRIFAVANQKGGITSTDRRITGHRPP